MLKLKRILDTLLSIAALAAVLHIPVASAANPKVLKILLPPVADAQKALFDFQPMANFLEKHLKIRIEADVATSYNESVHALETKRADVAFLGAFSYVTARERTKEKVEPLVVGVTKSTGKSTYQSVIISRAALKIRHPKQFGRRHTFAFNDPVSTSGYLVPQWHMKNLGMDPNKDLGGVRFTGSHDATVTAVNFGEVDGGAADIRAFEYLLKQGLISPHRIKIIWKSPDLPGYPVTVRSELPAAIKYQLLKAFMGFPRDQANFDPAISHYEPAFDEQYNLIREIRGELGGRI